MNKFHGEEREMPFGKEERAGIGSGQYEQALDRLRKFANTDLSRVANLRELLHITNGVGSALYVVLQSAGGIQRSEFGYRKPGEEIDTAAVHVATVFRRKIPGKGYYMAMSSRGPCVYCDAYTLDDGQDQRSIFMAEVPLTEIQRSGDDFWDSHSGMMAVDWRGGNTTHYYPVNSPADQDVCRGYALVVRDVVEDVIYASPPPVGESELPSIE